MAYIDGTTRLFDGLKFDEAVAFYWRVLDEARKVEGPVPNHDASWVNNHSHQPDSSAYGWAVEDREKIRERDGYLVEEFQFLDFVIEKGNSSNEFVLTRKGLPEFKTGLEMVAQTLCSWGKNAADIAESTLGFVMQVELDALIPEVADYEVMVKDVNKVGGENRHASSMKEAMEIKSKLESSLWYANNKNLISEAAITVDGIGEIVFPAFGHTRFIPNFERRPAPMSNERFAEILAKRQSEIVEICRFWTVIACHADGFGNRFFEFEGTKYIAYCNHNVSMNKPASSELLLHYVGARSHMSLLTGYRLGLLKVWAESYGWDGNWQADRTEHYECSRCMGVQLHGWEETAGHENHARISDEIVNAIKIGRAIYHTDGDIKFIW